MFTGSCLLALLVLSSPATHVFFILLSTKQLRFFPSPQRKALQLPRGSGLGRTALRCQPGVGWLACPPPAVQLEANPSPDLPRAYSGVPLCTDKVNEASLSVSVPGKKKWRRDPPGVMEVRMVPVKPGGREPAPHATATLPQVCNPRAEISLAGLRTSPWFVEPETPSWFFPLSSFSKCLYS